MNNLNNKSQTHLRSPGTRVCIPWLKGDTISDWNETCAWAIEHFGLPGGKYTTEVSSECMDFYFVDERDAILFELTWG